MALQMLNKSCVERVKLPNREPLHPSHNGMNIQLSPNQEPSPFEVLDVQVRSRQNAGQSRLSVRFWCRHARHDDQLRMPGLSWYDANLLQHFIRQLASTRRIRPHQTDLPDAGLRLTGSVQRQAGRLTTGRTIRIEPLPGANQAFAPFEINGSQTDIRNHAGQLYQRMWEAFCRG
jgi:hypothetical protein